MGPDAAGTGTVSTDTGVWLGGATLVGGEIASADPSVCGGLDTAAMDAGTGLTKIDTGTGIGSLSPRLWHGGDSSEDI